MKLWYSKASPVARKVLTVIHHHHLQDEVELISANSFDPDSEHNQYNPVGKIPVLKTSDNINLVDSRVISEYLDKLGQQAKLFKSDDTRWHDLSLQAVADGMLDNAIPVVAEQVVRKDGGKPWQARIDQLLNRTKNSLTYLNNEVQSLDDNLSIGKISVVSIAQWVEFRQNFFAFNPRELAPELYAWTDHMENQHPCLKQTKPS